MFSGIIEKTAPVLSMDRTDQQAILKLNLGWLDVILGESIAINGACLTVSDLSQDCATFFISRETLDRTSLGTLTSQSWVNLERALQVNARLSGHIVQGHVDGLARIVAAEAVGDSHKIRFEIPRELSRYCVEKGSITLDGVSLTINRVCDPTASPAWAEVMIIPHTWEHTTFRHRAMGDLVNLEVDMIAKYVERMRLT